MACPSLCQIWLFTVILIPRECYANDPEVLQQLSKHLYSILPDPAVPNRLSNGQQMGVQLSVAIESAEFGHNHDDYVCRATVSLTARWPITDAKISESPMLQMVGGSMLLDVERVWRPRVVLAGARQLNPPSRRLELQTFTTSAPSRTPLLHGGGGGKSARQPVYVMSEIFNVEVLCSTPAMRNYLGAIHCPIIFNQETFYRETSDYIWQDGTTCTLLPKASEKIAYVTISTKKSEVPNYGGTQSSLEINLCFNPIALVLRAGLPALFFTVLSFALLWSLSCGPRLITITQGSLILLCLATWTHFTGIIPTRFTMVDAWFIIWITFLVTLCEHRRLDRMVKTRQIQQQRRVYSALSAAAFAEPKLASCGMASGCGGCSCAGGFCGAGVGGGCGGFTGLIGEQMNPPPMDLTHLDICNEAYLRSASSELSKDSSEIMSLWRALRLRCAKNSGLGVVEPNDLNLRRIEGRYAASSTTGAPLLSSENLLQPLDPIPPSYYTTVIAVVLPFMYLFAVIVFWVFFGSLDTVPTDCLVGSTYCHRL